MACLDEKIREGGFLIHWGRLLQATEWAFGPKFYMPTYIRLLSKDYKFNYGYGWVYIGK
jgi:hypothetical protein